MKLNRIKVQRTAHFYSLNKYDSCKRILFCIHGYAQTAEEFMHEFNFLKDKDIFVVCPEGLSKFYNKEKKAVSSWMTSLHREDEITDYIAYLNSVLKTISANERPPLSVLAFSQGVSTCLRWLDQIDYDLERIDLCAGSIPPELSRGNKLLTDSTIAYWAGDQDPFLSHNKGRFAYDTLQLLYPQAKYKHFKGKHEIADSCKESLFRWADSI